MTAKQATALTFVAYLLSFVVCVSLFGAGGLVVFLFLCLFTGLTFVLFVMVYEFFEDLLENKKGAPKDTPEVEI